MGLKDIKKYFSSKSKQNNEVLNAEVELNTESVNNNSIYKIDKDRMSENYFETIFHNDILMDIIAVVKPCKPTHRIYRHYRSFEDYEAGKYYAQEFVSQFSRNMGDVIVNHKHTRTTVQHDEVDEITEEKGLNIKKESVLHEAEHIVTYKGNKYILTQTKSKTNLYPDNTVFGFTYDMDEYAEYIIENETSSLSDNIGPLYKEHTSKRIKQGEKKPSVSITSEGDEILFKNISKFVEDTMEYYNIEAKKSKDHEMND